jgi:hypothetical protein
MLRDVGLTPDDDDAYASAYVEHYDRFPTPPAYPGKMADSVAATF